MANESLLGLNDTAQTMMKSPLVGRRSHIRPSSSQKRVSFHQDQMRHPEDLALLSHATSQSCLIADERILIKSPSIRRYHSEISINQQASPIKCPPMIAERGAPEGQEDPEGPRSECHETTTQFLLKAYLRRKSIQSKRFNATIENKQRFLKWADKKWENLRLTPVLPCSQVNTTVLNKVAFTLDITKSKVDEELQPINPALIRLNLDDRYQVVKCCVDFYGGAPCSRQLIITESKMYLINAVPTIFWKIELTDIKEVEVKWNYSVMTIHTAGYTRAFTVDFVDPHDLRSAASFLDVSLRKIYKELRNVSIEPYSGLLRYWHPWIVKWGASYGLTDKCAVSVHFLGLLHYEETLFLHNQQSDDERAKCGHLMYFSSTSKKWHAGYFAIKDGVLYQFSLPNDLVPMRKISLSEEECIGYGRNFNSQRPHTIELQFRDGSSLLLAAASESEATDWLASLSESSFIWDNVSPSACGTPIACGALVTDQHIFLFNTTQMDQPIASASLDVISVILTSLTDMFCLIELECREASEGAGDWILYFKSEASFEDFLKATKRPLEILSSASSSTLRNKSLSLRAV